MGIIGMNPNCCFLLEGTETWGAFGVGVMKLCEKLFFGVLADAVGIAGVIIWAWGLNGFLGEDTTGVVVAAAGAAFPVADGMTGTAGIMNFDDALFACV